MNHIYTASKLATSTCERKLARITPYTTDGDGVTIEPTKTDYVTVYRSPNNRASRKAALRAKADIITDLVVLV